MKPTLGAMLGAALLLVVCGGGGGTGPSATNGRNSVDDPASTKDLVGGSPLDVPGSEIAASARRELRQADTLLAEYHDPDSFFGTIRSNRRGVVCNRSYGRVCTSDFLEETTETCRGRCQRERFRRRAKAGSRSIA